MFLKKQILSIYNFLLPKESRLRRNLYNKYLWHIFPDILDAHLQKLTKGETGIKFIEIGANDGISWDPLFKFIKKYKWEGILVEPHPTYYRELVENYKAINPGKIHFENIAISDENGKKELYYFSNINKSDPDYLFLKCLSSFNKGHLLKHCNDYPELEIKSVTVNCTTLNQLIEKYKFRAFDLLLIDAEGVDFEIIQSIDFELIKPRIIFFEHFHFNSDMKKQIDQLLKKHLYKMIEDGLNTIAFQS